MLDEVKSLRELLLKSDEIKIEFELLLDEYKSVILHVDELKNITLSLEQMSELLNKAESTKTHIETFTNEMFQSVKTKLNALPTELNSTIEQTIKSIIIDKTHIDEIINQQIEEVDLRQLTAFFKEIQKIKSNIVEKDKKLRQTFDKMEERLSETAISLIDTLNRNSYEIDVSFKQKIESITAQIDIDTKILNEKVEKSTLLIEEQIATNVLTLIKSLNLETSKMDNIFKEKTEQINTKIDIDTEQFDEKVKKSTSLLEEVDKKSQSILEKLKVVELANFRKSKIVAFIVGFFISTGIGVYFKASFLTDYLSLYEKQEKSYLLKEKLYDEKLKERAYQIKEEEKRYQEKMKALEYQEKEREIAYQKTVEEHKYQEKLKEKKYEDKVALLEKKLATLSKKEKILDDYSNMYQTIRKNNYKIALKYLEDGQSFIEIDKVSQKKCSNREKDIAYENESGNLIICLK